ncbi:hypothetical protein QE152_g12383 [Popillia japonica]|uniref:Uncharacterized protein n=1 Tax=Popillia japonica TaxID=7064 RepID=A0AAW1LRB2_POPJA
MENESLTSTLSTSTSLRKRKRIHEDDPASLLASAVSALNRQSNEPVDSLEAFGQLVSLEMENESRTSTPSTSTSLRKRKRIDKDDTSTLLASAVSALNSQSNEPVDSLEAFGQLVSNMVKI